MPVSAKDRGEKYRIRQWDIGRRSRNLWATDAEFQMLKAALAESRNQDKKGRTA